MNRLREAVVLVTERAVSGMCARSGRAEVSTVELRRKFEAEVAGVHGAGFVSWW